MDANIRAIIVGMRGSTIDEVLRELRLERERIDAAIAALEALTGVKAPPAAETTTTDPVVTGIEGLATLPSSVMQTRVQDIRNRTAAVERLFLQQPGRVWSATELAKACGEDATDQGILKTYYTIVGRLSAREIVEKAGRGRYRLKDTSTPAATGVEVSGESNQEDSPRREGR